MNLYDDYCYSTIQEAANAEIARPVQADSAGISVVTAFSVKSQTSVDLTINYKQFGNQQAATYLLNRIYPSCSQVGYQKSYSGLTSVDDATQLGWLMAGAFVAAFMIKVLRRVF
ncbi:hypothetical protein [Methylomonas sp. CM2]|uniref:hypothetical protein n=1 Tax=Methylomonas sp. CM2 TaxID=3417647 RepID=UPI003CEB4A6D